MLLALCALSLVGAGGAAAGAGGPRAPPPLFVPRCCSTGERLDLDVLGDAPTADSVAAACRPDTTGEPWAPRVYAPARGTFLPPGRLPQHWRVQEVAPPACAPLRVLPEHAAPYALLANNASLLERGADRALPPAQYCADAAAALVCAEAPRAPSKCCAAGRAWNGAACVDEEWAASAASDVLQELTALGAGPPRGGWPGCAGGSQYAERGALAGGKLAGDGALLLADGTRLAAGAWCAEAVAGTTGARVLACSARAEGPARHALYGVALAVGALFLLLTLLASLALPAAHHALHWRCQTHYVAALLAGDTLLAGTQLAGAAVPAPLCRVLAVCMHFLFLSAFFWLNTMCFNIWWTFR